MTRAQIKTMRNIFYIPETSDKMSLKNSLAIAAYVWAGEWARCRPD